MTVIARRCRVVTYGASYIQRGFGSGGATVEEGVGEFLADFDCESNEGRGAPVLTSDPLNAKRFATANEAVLFMQQIPPRRRWRDDGRPNRPLTDFGWDFQVRLDPAAF